MLEIAEQTMDWLEQASYQNMQHALIGKRVDFVRSVVRASLDTPGRSVALVLQARLDNWVAYH